MLLWSRNTTNAVYAIQGQAMLILLCRHSSFPFSFELWPFNQLR
jgi:hypothetical protein